MFKFGFQPEELNTEFAADAQTPAVTKHTVASSITIPCADCVEILPTAVQKSNTVEIVKHGLILFAGGQEIAHVKSDVLIGDLIEREIKENMYEEAVARQLQAEAAVANAAQEAAAAETDAHDTDLIPGVYEGGGKIWECTRDLGDFISAEDDNGYSLLQEVVGRTVLDLGCGAGILGALAMQQGAYLVHFQDYNREIITKVTIPNAVLNSSTAEELQSWQLNRCRFFAGDWSHYVRRYADVQQFDMILTCETIYNRKNHQKIIDVLKRMLRPVTGVAYLAAKTYYFGVGGGVRLFEHLLETDGTLQSEVVWRSTQNVAREILKITHRTPAV